MKRKHLSETQTAETADEKETEESEASEEKEPGVVEETPSEGEDQKEALDAVLAKGKCGKKVKWSLDKKGTFKITGKGAMKNYAVTTAGKSSAPWAKYMKKIKKVVISKKVTTVGDFAFCGCEFLTSVKLPKNLKSIGAASFCMCSRLKSISIPKKVKTIGLCAFGGAGLTRVVLPNSVKSIDDYAFEMCPDLTEVTIPASVKTIGEEAFYNCAKLNKVNIPICGATTIGSMAFGKCESLTSIRIPLSVTKLGSYAFYDCTGLTDAQISSKLYSESSTVFTGCTNLTNVTNYSYADPGEGFFSENGAYAFVVTNPDINGNGTVLVAGYDPYLEKVVIPNVVAYKGVTYKVTRIERNFAIGSGDNINMKSLVIGSNVTSIADQAFGSCVALESVTGGAKLQTIGREAFANCPKLTVFNISSKTLKKIGPYAFNGATALTTLQLKKTTKLTKSGVKDSLKNSSVKTVKVKKSKVKKYKKIFKKKNCGVRVKVKK